ncbi:MAG: squalene/phytoene synthase family protein [Rhodobacteraceae bacterium]|nr:squalene/phytoene synthase family protein [Paracoccaceae bacterium]
MAESHRARADGLGFCCGKWIWNVPSALNMQSKLQNSSFYWPIRLVPSERRAALAAVYEWCSSLDDIVDGQGRADGKAATLFAWRQWLAAPDSDPPHERDLARKFAATFDEFGVARADAEKLLDGFTQDLAGDVRAPATADLIRYCQRVAGAPGRMCLTVLGWHAPDAGEFADAAGVAVQLTNILRDIEEDALRDRLYIPREALDAAGIDASDPKSAISHPNFDRAWLAVALLANAHFLLAESLLPKDRRKQIRPALAMLAIYRALHAGLRKRGWRRNAPRFRLAHWKYAAITARALCFGTIR